MSKLILIVLVLATMLFAQQKRAITFEDFFSMKRLTDFTVSPDGRTVAYSVRIPNIEENNFKTDIWILDLKSGESTLFTKSEKSSSGAVWSPDGNCIYFNRGGQIWKKDLYPYGKVGAGMVECQYRSLNVSFSFLLSPFRSIPNSYFVPSGSRSIFLIAR